MRRISRVHRIPVAYVTGEAGNEEADRKAGMMVYGGRVWQFLDQVTPAGNRQEYPIHL